MKIRAETAALQPKALVILGVFASVKADPPATSAMLDRRLLAHCSFVILQALAALLNVGEVLAPSGLLLLSLSGSRDKASVVSYARMTDAEVLGTASRCGDSTKVI
ncbi:hypothetical protein H0H92_014334 [Tricholoma furcatifolium]|nr:hypothetical protein H0H92_014334 [Tricholoma furcatifolium]